MNEYEFEEIVNLYGLKLDYIEPYGRVNKIYTDKGEFALKRLPAKHGIDFFYYMQHLYQLGYNRIVPIYPALDGRYAVLYDQSLYYLMPWLKNQEHEGNNDKFERLFRELARLHTLSAREEDVDKEIRQEHYENMKARWESELEGLDTFIEQCETKTYMSPFQLLFCTYYSEISGGYRYSLKKMQEWHESVNDDYKARSVIVHGKLSNEHFLYDEHGVGYFANFEQANRASPIHDLLPFLSRTLYTYPKQNDECIKWLGTYFRHFPFKDEEMTLFLSYFAHPGPTYRVIEKYFSNHHKKQEMKYVKQLQKSYWQMKNIEYVVMKLDEMYKRKESASD